MPLDEDEEHARYDPDQVAAYFAAATRAALVLAAFRAPYRGRSTPVNAWWGSFDLAVNLFSGLPADPPSNDFIMRNAMDAQEVAVGWWPGDPRYAKAAFYAYAHPAPEGFARRRSRPRPRAGTRRSASTSSTGTTSAPAPTRTRRRSSSPARRSVRPVWSAGGTRTRRERRRVAPARDLKNPPGRVQDPPARRRTAIVRHCWRFQPEANRRSAASAGATRITLRAASQPGVASPMA